MSDKPTVGRITFSPELDDAAKASREMGLAGSGVVLGPLFAAGYNAAASEMAALKEERDRLAAELTELRTNYSNSQAALAWCEQDGRRVSAELSAARAALASYARLTDGGAMDLTDSPKSLVAALRRLALSAEARQDE